MYLNLTDDNTLANAMMRDFIAKAEDMENPAWRIIQPDSDKYPNLFPASTLSHTDLGFEKAPLVPAEVRAFCRKAGTLKPHECARVAQIWLTSYRVNDKNAYNVVHITYVIKVKNETIYATAGYYIYDDGGKEYLFNCSRH